MKRTLVAVLVALLAAGLWLVWAFQHEHTSIRAPWTGFTYVAALAGFIAVGIVGRGWRALASAAAAAALASLLVDPLVYRSETVEPGSTTSCDPGCISREAVTVFYSVATAVLAAVGILLRRAFGVAKRRREPAAA